MEEANVSSGTQRERAKNNISQAKKNISRRDFIKIGAAVAATGGTAIVAHETGKIPTGDPTAAAATPGSESLVKTVCGMCPSGCGLEVRVVDGRAVKVEGDPLHPLNQGVCCLRGQTSLEALYSPERLQHPRVQLGERGSGDWKEISWDEAFNLVASKLDEVRKNGMARTVAFVHGETRGEMRGLIQRFMQAYGSPNTISTESLGQGTARLAMLLSQGINGMPAYDLNNANYVMTFGGNLLESSRNVMAALGAVAFMRRGRPQRGKLVAVHPRLSITGIKADEWIPIRPGTYAALALGMANVIINSNLYDLNFVRDFTFGFEDFEDESGTKHQGFKSLVLERYTLERAASITGIPGETIARLAGEFATNRPALAVMPTEAGELASGGSLYTVLAIHALNALVGSIDCAGGVLVQRFPTVKDWPELPVDATAEASFKQPRIDGAGTPDRILAGSVYQDLGKNIITGDPYPLNILFLYNANPVYELPGGGEFVTAMQKIPFVVSFASTLDESAAHADLILPASTFLETWGDDFLEGTGYAGVSLRRPVVEAVHDTRDPGDVLLQIAAKLGGTVAQALPWKSYQELMRYRLSGIDMEWEKFETNGSWSEMVYFNAKPGSPAWSNVVGRDRLTAPKDGRFDFFSRELFAILNKPEDLACLPHFDIPATLQQGSDVALEYPFLLVTQPLITEAPGWQGILPTLQEVIGLQTHVRWSSWVEINPEAAKELDVKDGDLVWVESESGNVQVPVRLYEGLWPNAVFLPPGQGHRTLVRWGRKSPNASTVGANPNQLMKAMTEAITGQAVYTPTRVRIRKV